MPMRFYCINIYVFIYMHLLILLKKKMKNLNIRYILYNIIDNIIIRKIYLEDQIEDKNFKLLIIFKVFFFTKSKHFLLSTLEIFLYSHFLH